MKEKVTYGEKQKAYALALLAKGSLTRAEISAETGIKKSTLGAMKCNAKKAKNKNVATAATPLQRETATAERQVQPAENAQGAAVLRVFLKNAVANFHPADLLYYTGVALACAALVATLQGVGYPVAGCIALVAAIALQGVKTSQGVERVVYAAFALLFEAACFLVHIAWANAALWRNVKALPFDIWQTQYFSADMGKMVDVWQGQTAWPGYCAIGVAVVLFVCSLFAFWIAVSGGIQNKKK